MSFYKKSIFGGGGNTIFSASASVSASSQICPPPAASASASASLVTRRFKRTQNLYKRLNDEWIKKLVFQDEKLFTVQLKKNKRWDRFYIPKSSKRVSEPIMVDPASTKINAEYYTAHLKNDLVSAIKQFYLQNDAISFRTEPRLTQRTSVRNSCPRSLVKGEWSLELSGHQTHLTLTL